jgi:hypothetical protein
MGLRRAVIGGAEIARYIALHALPLRACERIARRAPRLVSGRRVVVSLTTMPDRIQHLRPTINSLLDQSLRPDAIYLNLPDRSHRFQSRYTVPGFLDQVSSLEIRSCGYDWGPATKVIPTLQAETDPDTMIIVVDDDQIYPRRMIERFVFHEDDFPDAALCARGFRIPLALHHPLRDTVYGTRVDSPVEVEVMQGSAGVLVKPRFFTDEFLDYTDAPESATMVDDVWIGGNLARNGVRKLVVPFLDVYARIETLGVKRSLSLSHNENRDHSNNDTMYEYFREYWKLFD